MKLDILEVEVGQRKRKLDENKVRSLAESFASIGQLQPITVIKEQDLYRLIAGLHRLEAAKFLGWQTIEAAEFEGDAIAVELAEIDENLMRNDLTVLEQGEHLARRQELVGRNVGRYAKSNGETVSPLKTTPEIAKDLGLTERSAQHRMQVSRNITPEVKDAIRNTEIANSTTQLLELARLTPDKQAEVAQSIVAGAVTVHEAIKTIKQALRDTEGVKRAEVESTTKLYQGDMLDVLNTLGNFDLVVADPPYNVTKWEWDKLGSRDQFLQETQSWLEAIIPHLNDKYNIFWFCSPSYAADIEILMRGMGLKINSRLVWHRRNMAKGSDAKYKFIDSWEMIFHIGNRELNFPSTWDDSRFDVQTFAVPQTNFQDTKYHPTQKPQELIKWLVTYGSFIGDKILDPFAGSGTTATTCDGREYTLIEQDTEYIKIIEQRLGVKVEDVRL